MPTPPVSVTEFKARFDRDFSYGATNDFVKDLDITNALLDATFVFNPGLWDDTDQLKAAFNYAAAHMLVLNLQAAGGLSLVNLSRGLNSRGGGTTQSKSVGSVSVSYAVPAFVTNDKILSQFMRTDYGQKYLQLLVPRIVGAVGVVEGWNDLDGSQNVP